MSQSPILPERPQKRGTSTELHTAQTQVLSSPGSNQTLVPPETVVHTFPQTRHQPMIQLWSPEAIIILGIVALAISLGSNVYEIHNTALTVQLVLHPTGEDLLLFWKSKYWMLYLPAYIIQIAEALWTIINGSSLDEIVPPFSSVREPIILQKTMDHSATWWICSVFLGGCIIANAVSDMISMVFSLPRDNPIVFIGGVLIAFIFTLLLIGFSMFVFPLSLRIIAYGWRMLWKRIGMQWMIFAFEHWGWYAKHVEYDLPTQEGN